MAVLGTCLIVYCIFFEMPLENMPYVLTGAVFVILYEFHGRIDGKIGLGKFETSVKADNRDGKTEEMPVQEPPSPHLRDVSEIEWQRPGEARRRRR